MGAAVAPGDEGRAAFVPGHADRHPEAPRTAPVGVPAEPHPVDGNGPGAVARRCHDQSSVRARATLPAKTFGKRPRFGRARPELFLVPAPVPGYRGIAYNKRSVPCPRRTSHSPDLRG